MTENGAKTGQEHAPSVPELEMQPQATPQMTVDERDMQA